MNRFSFQTVMSKPITVGTHTIQIESKQLIVSFSFGGFFFQTPTAVYNLNTSERQTIVDVNRLSIVLFLIMGLLFKLFTSRSNR